jgi:DHA1 family tetracycline resistance protein-like MFS transporter
MIRKLLPILGVTFIDIIGFSMLLPLMPYFVTHFGMSPLVVGILMSTFSLCQLISGPVWGNISDRVGRKWVLIVSQIGATIGWAALAFAPNIATLLIVPPIVVVFIARIVEGISGGNIGITQAYVADLCEPKDRSRAFGLIGATFAMGMIFGPAGGSILFDRFGFSAPFLAAAGLQLITLLLTIVLLPESRSKNEDEERVRLRDIMLTFSNVRLAPLLVQKLALSLALYAWFAVIALYLQGQMHFSVVETMRYFSLFAIVNFIFNAFGVERASNMFGDRAMSSVGMALLVSGFAITPFVHNIYTLSVTIVLFSCGMAFANNGLTAMISNAATDREQGTVLGVSSSLDSVSGILSPPLSTGILTRYGSPFAGIASLVMAIIGLGLGIRNSILAPTVHKDVSEEATLLPAEEPA